MTDDLPPIEAAKRAAARYAAESVENGMKIGLGTGSTAAWLVRRLGERVRDEGLNVSGVPTSEATAELARKLGVPTMQLDEAGELDLTIDGTDEFDPDLNLIKGGGGALLRELIVARASTRMVVIADQSKQVEQLGKFPLPVEILPFGSLTTKRLVERKLAELGMEECEVNQRLSGGLPFITDGGNHILDLHLNRIDDPHRLNLELNMLPGVMENGLFINICNRIVIGHSDGRVELRDATTTEERKEHLSTTEVPNLFADI